MLIESVMPTYDVIERHETVVDASPADTLAAVRRFDAAKSWPVAALFVVRGLPHVLRGPVRPRRKITLDFLLDQGFRVVGEAGDEIVLGVVGKFWRLDSGIREIDATDFAAFGEPGFAKAAMNFYVEESGSGTRVITETRVVGTDDGATKKFRRYWLLVGPFSALIRRLLLAQIKQESEKVPTGP